MKYRKRAVYEAVKWIKDGDCPEWARHVITERGDHFILTQPDYHRPLRGESGWWIFHRTDWQPSYVDLHSSDEDFNTNYEPISGT